jgi:hypothetical protein
VFEWPKDILHQMLLSRPPWAARANLRRPLFIPGALHVLQDGGAGGDRSVKETLKSES